jgi:Sulfotransferase family
MTASAPPFLIIGAQRSGTSLLSRILNEHPNIAVPSESFFFNTFGPLRRFYGDLSLEANRDRLIDDALSTFKIREWRPPLTREAVVAELTEPTLGGVFRALLDAWTATQGKRRWGEKTPQHVLHWDHVGAALPDAKIIHIVRDGRDVALGLIAARFGPATTFRAAERWLTYVDSIEAVKAATTSERLHEIRYEDLLLEPERVLTGLCSFLGERYAKTMLDFHKNADPYGHGYRSEHRNLHKPLMRDRVGRWRRRMSARDVRIFESVAGPALERYGYALATPATPLAGWQRQYLRWVVDPPVKGLALLRNRPGQAEELHLLGLRSRIVVRQNLRKLVGLR